VQKRRFPGPSLCLTLSLGGSQLNLLLLGQFPGLPLSSSGHFTLLIRVKERSWSFGSLGCYGSLCSGTLKYLARSGSVARVFTASGVATWQVAVTTVKRYNVQDREDKRLFGSNTLRRRALSRSRGGPGSMSQHNALSSSFQATATSTPHADLP
jgi:hypothetical protein